MEEEMKTMKVNDQFDPTIFAIFGGAGDLAWRKLVPALFDLSQDRSLPQHFEILAVDRAELDDDNLRQRLYEGVARFCRRCDNMDAAWKLFAKHINYLRGDFTKQQTYATLGERCEKFETEWDAKAHRIFYMATPPSLFGEIPKHLAEAGLSHDKRRARLVIEKPIGYDVESARALNAMLAENFDERQIFRIDHYLGKETVQNILAFRFANPLFEPIWNRRYVDYVTITVAEEVGIGHRGGYYDGAGALRDMVQNHLMQLLCLVAMEPMVSFHADEIRNKKVDVLHAVRPIHNVMRGQYDKGKIRDEEICSYREEDGVSPKSQTETFVALKLFVDNWRWQDVPFYLRTGKRLTQQVSQIAIQFRAVPHRSFPSEAALDWQPSRLVMSIQPAEGIVLHFLVKRPGPAVVLQTVEMQFNYRDYFSTLSPDAYETLLWDVMKNDATLFMRSDQIEAAWQLMMPILKRWEETPPTDFPNYAAGTWGPEAAQELLAKHGHTWSAPTKWIGSQKKKRRTK
jgi:glucose-6-phosphate 1-dehydrogenase